MMKQQSEQVALTRCEKAVEHMRVLADGKMGKDFHRRARLREPFKT